MITLDTIRGLGKLVEVPWNAFSYTFELTFVFFAAAVVLFLLKSINIRNKFLIVVSYMLDMCYRVIFIIALSLAIIAIILLILSLMSFSLLILMKKLYEVSVINNNMKIFETLASPVSNVIGLSFTIFTTLIGGKLFFFDENKILDKWKNFFNIIYEDLDNLFNTFFGWKHRYKFPILLMIIDLSMLIIFKNNKLLFKTLKYLLFILLLVFIVIILVSLIVEIGKGYKKEKERYIKDNDDKRKVKLNCKRKLLCKALSSIIKANKIDNK